MKPVTMLHNPRCSKSRETLALLESRGIEPRIVDYQSETPSIEELDAILNMLGMQPRELMRSREPEYAALDLGNPDLSREELLAALHANPRLIERPIVIHDGKAALGRPPEAVLAIL